MFQVCVRQLSALMFGLGLALSVQAQSNDIVIGQSTALTGILAELGIATSSGAKAYFDYINEQGGVNGHKIRFVVMDDAYDAAKSLSNVRQLLEKEKAIVLFGMLGTPANTALIPVVTEAGVPNFAPLTGTEALRKPLNRMIFNIRAGYDAETDKIIEHLGARGIKRVGVVYQNNAFGKEGLAAVQLAAEKYKLKLSASASLNNDSSDLDKAVSEMEKGELQSIILVTAGKPSSDFIKAFNQKTKGIQYFALSVLASQSAINALGKDGVGVIVSQVMPFPFSATSSVVREYQKLMSKAGIKDYSYASMEGFLNAKVLVEAIRHIGRDVNSERLVSALEGMGRVDFGGFIVNFNKNEHQGSRYVELTVISKDGRFLR